MEVLSVGCDSLPLHGDMCAVGMAGSGGADLEEEGLHLVLEQVKAYLVRQQRVILPHQYLRFK